MVGPDVEAWQRFLGITADGYFGADTQLYTRMWQKARELKPDGIVGPLTRAAASIITTRPPPIPPFDGKPAAFIEARYYDRHRFGSPISLIVVHAAQTGEGPKSARGTAGYFTTEMLAPKRQPDGTTKMVARKASAHYCVDAGEIIQCVHDASMAWGAGFVNRRAIHVELAGRSEQTLEQWRDPYSETMLRRASVLISDRCRLYNIPIKRLYEGDLLANAAGLCGHDTVTLAYKVKGGHLDPGKHFPWSHFIDLIMAADGMGGKPHVA